MDELTNKDVNNEWMVRFIYLLNKEHEIFKEHYCAPKREKLKENVDD